jgi:hypothetical protein
MKNHLPTALALLAALFCASLGCKSRGAAPEHAPADLSALPCTCGTPEADLEGCAHWLCLEGQNNPENPDCVCGSLSLPQPQ